jgi:cysteine synthase A
MSSYAEDNTKSIGNTPMVRINHLTKGHPGTLLAKIEGRNPAYSVKCRIGANMVWEAERSGALKPGGTIVEPTSGNTGIALAYVAAARGYKCILTMPESMSVERRKVLTALGATVVLTPASGGMKAAIDKATELAKANGYFMPQQFQNPANPAIHRATTGPEIWAQTDVKIDVLVSGVGTGGTITGVSQFIKQDKGKKILSVAVEPVESPVITQTKNGEALKPGPHKIQGVGAGFIPDVLDVSLVDRVEQVSSQEAIETARLLSTKEGILSGISCGAAVCAALRLSGSKEFAGKTIVVILPDAAERYLAGPLFEGVFNDQGLAANAV